MRSSANLRPHTAHAYRPSGSGPFRFASSAAFLVTLAVLWACGAASWHACTCLEYSSLLTSSLQLGHCTVDAACFTLHCFRWMG